MNINFLHTYFLTENLLSNNLINKHGKIIGVSGLLGNISAIPTKKLKERIINADQTELLKIH